MIFDGLVHPEFSCLLFSHCNIAGAANQQSFINIPEIDVSFIKMEGAAPCKVSKRFGDKHVAPRRLYGQISQVSCETICGDHKFSRMYLQAALKSNRPVIYGCHTTVPAGFNTPFSQPPVQLQHHPATVDCSFHAVKNSRTPFILSGSVYITNTYSLLELTVNLRYPFTAHLKELCVRTNLVSACRSITDGFLTHCFLQKIQPVPAPLDSSEYYIFTGSLHIGQVFRNGAYTGKTGISRACSFRHQSFIQYHDPVIGVLLLVEKSG